MTSVRSFRSDDIDALYAISLATGSAGGDASTLYADRKLIGHIYSAPYAVLEPSLALVFEDPDGVAGFAIGVMDTCEWEDRLEMQWWPQLRAQYSDPPEAKRDSWSPDERRASMIHHPERTPDWVTERYPAHLHLNLLPRAQGRGVGAMLFERWRTIAIKRGARGIHVGVNHANARAGGFWKKSGFVTLSGKAAAGRTIWMGYGQSEPSSVSGC